MCCTCRCVFFLSSLSAWTDCQWLLSVDVCFLRALRAARAAARAGVLMTSWLHLAGTNSHTGGVGGREIEFEDSCLLAVLYGGDALSVWTGR